MIINRVKQFNILDFSVNIHNTYINEFKVLLVTLKFSESGSEGPHYDQKIFKKIKMDPKMIFTAKLLIFDKNV